MIKPVNQFLMTVLPNPGSCPMPFRVCFVFRHSEPVLCQRIIIYITHHSFAYLTRISHPSWIQVQSIMNRLCTSSKVLILDTSIGLWWPAIQPACLLGILMQFKLSVVPARDVVPATCHTVVQTLTTMTAPTETTATKTYLPMPSERKQLTRKENVEKPPEIRAWQENRKQTWFIFQ